MLVTIPLMGAGVAKDDLTVPRCIEMAMRRTMIIGGHLSWPRRLGALICSEGTQPEPNGEASETERSSSQCGRYWGMPLKD